VARVRNRTERDNEDLVRLYLEDIGRHQLLTKDDEARLAQDIEAGKAARETLDTVDKGLTRAEKRDLQRLVRKGEGAQRQFVQSNLRLVVSIAKRYQASGMPLLDLVQEGNLGLIHAVEKFDWRKGFKFSTYATWWIRQAIQRGIANAGRTIRLPVHAADNLARLQKERAGLEARLGRPATLDELAEELDLAPERVKELIPHLAEPVSLETPVGGEEDSSLADFVEDDVTPVPTEAVTSKMRRLEVQELLETLSHRERKVLELRFGLKGEEPRTLEEVGQRFGVTRERIRQIEAKTLTKLKSYRDSKKLREYIS
jgi:RNA polymerase sigma factor (sigma-70 family)